MPLWYVHGMLLTERIHPIYEPDLVYRGDHAGVLRIP